MLNAVEEIEEEVVQFTQSGLEKALGGDNVLSRTLEDTLGFIYGGAGYEH